MSSAITDPPHPSLMILIFHPHCLPYIHLFLLLPHVLIGLSHIIHFTPSSSLHSIPLFIFLTLLTTTPPAYPQHWAYHMTYLPSLSMPNYVSLLLYQPSLMTMPNHCLVFWTQTQPPTCSCISPLFAVVNIVLNVHKNCKAYWGRGGRWYGGRGEGDYIHIATLSPPE